MSVFRMSPVLAAALATVAQFMLTAHLPVRAADWQRVIVGKTETVELDKARIARGAGGTTGWSRILLGREVNDPGGVYNTIHAQNLYDCDGRRFTTLRRAYFHGDNLIREESVSRQRANSVQVGSIDERLLNEACRARTIGEAAGVAEAAGRAALDAQDADRPTAMHADMRTLAEPGRTRVVPVADAVVKPVGPAAAVPAAPATAPPTPSGEKPRHIVLPAIDKAAADQAAASFGQKSAASPAPAGTATRSEAGATAKPLARAAASPAENVDERRLRELQ